MSSHAKKDKDKKKVEPSIVRSLGSLLQAILVLIIESIPVAIENFAKVIMWLFKAVSNTSVLAHASAHHAYARKTNVWPPKWFSIVVGVLIAAAFCSIAYFVITETSMLGGVVYLICIWSLLQVGSKKKHS